MQQKDINKLINISIKQLENLFNEINNLPIAKTQAEHKKQELTKYKIFAEINTLKRLKIALKRLERNNKKLSDYEQTNFIYYDYGKPTFTD